MHSSGLVDAPKVLADIVESLIGAIYIDCGCSFDVTWEVRYVHSVLIFKTNFKKNQLNERNVTQSVRHTDDICMHATGGEEAAGTNDHSGNPSDTSGDEAARVVPRQENEFEDEGHVERRWSG